MGSAVIRGRDASWRPRKLPETSWTLSHLGTYRGRRPAFCRRHGAGGLDQLGGPAAITVQSARSSTTGVEYAGKINDRLAAGAGSVARHGDATNMQQRRYDAAVVAVIIMVGVAVFVCRTPPGPTDRPHAHDGATPPPIVEGHAARTPIVPTAFSETERSAALAVQPEPASQAARLTKVQRFKLQRYATLAGVPEAEALTLVPDAATFTRLCGLVTTEATAFAVAKDRWRNEGDRVVEAKYLAGDVENTTSTPLLTPPDTASGEYVVTKGAMRNGTPTSSLVRAKPGDSPAFDAASDNLHDAELVLSAALRSAFRAISESHHGGDR